MSGKRKLAALSAVLLAGAMMSACTSNGGGNGSSGGTSGGGGDGSIDGSSSSGGPTNDGNGNTNITQNGTPVTGHFICTTGAKAYGDVTTVVGANGLVGAQLTALLNQLGATDVTALLNSVTQPNNVIDGKLSTFATFSEAAGLLGSPIDSIDLSVVMPAGTTVPAGKYAVYGLSFPNGTVNLSLLTSVAVTTSLAGVTQESNTLTQSQLALLGQGVVPAPAVWLGVQTTKAYDTATVSLTPSVLSVIVGDAMHDYELCVDGTLKQ